jgi:hypothetical protein
VLSASSRSSARADQLLRHVEELFSQRRKFGHRQTAMAVVHRFGQCVGDSGPHPDHGCLVDAELHGDGVGCLEADATDVSGQAVRVLRHDLHRVGAVGLLDTHRSRRPDAVAVQEHHDLADDLLLGLGG